MSSHHCSMAEAKPETGESPPSVDYGDGDEEMPSAAGGTTDAAGSHVDPAATKEEKFQEPKTLRPRRVEAALKNSKNFEEYRRNRPFKFLHMYSGPRDPLGEAIKLEAKRNRLEVVVLSLDNKLDPTLDLADPEGFRIMKDDINKGEWDYTHAGYPCGSFSMARHHKVPGQPGPVRDKANIYGLPTNTVREQNEADRGTRMATQAAEIYEAQVKSCAARRVPALATLENPPGNEVSGSSWDVPEVDGCLRRTDARKIHYNNCAFQTKEKFRFLKPGVWAGRMQGIEKIQRVCRCPAWVKHTALVGKTLTAQAAEYPMELAELVAREVVGVWKKTLNLEWWRYQLETKSLEVNELQRAWLENEEKKERGETKRLEPSKRAASMAFKIDNIEEDDLPQSSKGRPTKVLKEEHNRLCLGGMRNPAKTVSRVTQMGITGKKIADMWDEFVESHPNAIQVAENYGKADNKFDTDILELWTQALRDNLPKTPERPLVVKENWEFNSPCNADLWEAWSEEALDPDVYLADFMRRGAPLGMEVQIPPSGVFPPSLDEENVITDPAGEFEELKHLRNYSSVREQTEQATIEIDRYVEKNFAKRASWGWVKEVLGETGTVSKMALILKEKDDGSVKRRIILDMRRSFGNARCKTDERIVLPRITDVLHMLQDMWKVRSDEKGRRRSKDADDFEIYLLDLADAFCHFPVRKEELRHCVTPDEHDSDALVWIAMLFGYRAAPLIMGRLSSALGRLLQSILNPQQAQLQVYVDDVFVAMLGDRKTRHRKLASLLYTTAAFGVQLSLKKGERGRRVTWIGCVIEVPLVEIGEPEVVVLSVSRTMVDQVIAHLRSWERGGMGTIKDLRSTTGRLSWIGGILPRLRWTVNVLYATLKEVEKEQRDGTEDRRSLERSDTRSKRGLFPIKRLGGVHIWLLKLFENPIENLIRVERMKRPRVSMGIITDASPKGWGAILVKIPEGVHDQLIPVEAVEGLISQKEADLLQVPFGESASQSVMEALSVLRAIDMWGNKMQERAVMIRSDSSVALAMAKRLSSPSPALNFLAAEIVLRLEKFQIQRLTYHHLRGSWNTEADWLSRLTERAGKPRPPGLEGVHLKRAAPWSERHFWLKAPGDASEGGQNFCPQSNIFEHMATR